MNRNCVTSLFSLAIVSVIGVDARGASVSGRVSVKGGDKPIVGARVTLFEERLATFFETRTDTDGGYELTSISAGSYRFGVAAPGFEYVEVGLEVVADTERNVVLGPETDPGAWEIIGDTLPELFDATDIGVLLPDGQIFYCHDTINPILFDPVTGEKSFPANSPTEQGCMNGTLLPDGQIIMVGGQDGSAPGLFTDAIRWVKAYDPSGDEWTGLPWLLQPNGRWYPGLVRLADGSFMAMGGGTAPSAQRTDTCERFDLATMTWGFTGSLLNPTEFSPTALLYTGEVLATWWPPQLYNPDTEQWRFTGNFVQPNRNLAWALRSFPDRP